MKKLKLASAVSLTLALLFTTQGSLVEAQIKNKGKQNDFARSFDVRSLKYTETTDKNGNKVIKIEEPEKFAQQMGFKKPHPNAVVGAVTIVESPEQKSFGNVSPLTGHRDPYVQVTRVYNTCGSDKIASTSKRGNGKPLELIVSQEEQAQYSTNVNINANIVSAGVGFNVTSAFKISSKETYDTKNDGLMYVIDAYSKNNSKDFDVYEWSSIFYKHRKTGEGKAHKPIGACFASWYY
ncbi:hypothetical protein FB479_104177 [Brevibacillus sp. AG162]|uniref:hypothetical protein n=1 Tax=Brevibacillus sp. AG162 TaxID=2572910 RepID=UPI00114DDB61|nr:hypothetical protein [Brevibacillus sp. AG162]TQK62862.1 hypothetical protein FB479_104177 [Brevibacillus sp. AG162]